MLATAALAFELLFLPQHAVWVLILSAAIYLLTFLAIDRRWQRKPQ
jgi:hypothetical protein